MLSSQFLESITLAPGTTRIGLNGEWDMEQLSEFTREYIQLYGFAYSLLPDLSDGKIDEINYIYGKFPWQGGYSTVNFFNQLFHKIPHPLHPKIQKIQYASPGYIELLEILAVAASIAKIIKSICVSIDKANETYRNIQKSSIDYKLSKINLTQEKLKLTRAQIDFCDDSSEKLSRLLGLTNEQNKLLEMRVGKNKAMKMKILLSVFRRAYPLAKKQVDEILDISGKGK